MVSAQGEKAGMGIGDMLSLFSMFCGGFLLLIGIWLYVSSTSGGQVGGAHERAAAPSPRIDHAEMTSEMEKLDERMHRLDDEMAGAEERGDRDRIKMVREDQADLMRKKADATAPVMEALEDYADSDAEAAQEKPKRRVELSEEDKQKREMGQLLSIFGGGLLLFGTCGFIFIRLRT